MTVEPVKKKNLFASLGKALRKKPKSKAKSMSDLTAHSTRRKNLSHQKNLDGNYAVVKNDSFQSESSSISKEDLDMLNQHYNNNEYIDEDNQDQDERESIASSQYDLDDRHHNGRLTDDDHDDIDDEKEQENGDEIGEDEDETQRRLDGHSVPKLPSGTTVNNVLF